MKIKTPVIIGLDASTTCTATTILNAVNGKLIDMYHVPMNNKKKFPDFWSKVIHIKNIINEKHNNSWDIKAFAIEEIAKRFSPGFSSAGTIITLAQFNVLVCYLYYEKYNMQPTYINVRSARKHAGIKIDYKDKSKTTKQKVLEFVCNSHPSYPWIYKKIKGKKKLIKFNEDLADSWIVANSAYMTLKNNSI